MALSPAIAYAADLPTRKTPAPPPVYAPVSDSGLYAGALVGGVFGGLTSTPGSGSTAGGLSTGTLLGYKWRYSPFVFGFEGDLSTNSLKQKFSGVGGSPATQIDNVYSAHARARLGYTLGDFEPFVAGGFALTDLSQSRQGPFEFDGASTRRPGWTIGAGVDARVTLPILGSSIIRAEYLYDHLTPTTLNLNGALVRTGGSQQYARLGLINYVGQEKPAETPLAANWAGNYAGVLGGYSAAHISSSGAGGSGAFNIAGDSVGIYTGKNWMFGQGMLGFEGSTAFASIKGNGPQPLALGPTSYKDYFVSDVRGRAGWAIDRWLPYIAGGVAFDDSAQSDPAAGTHRGDVYQYSATIGAGLEYMLNDRFSVRGEYAYAHSLGTITTKLDAETCCSQTRESHTVRLGLGYYFH